MRWFAEGKTQAGFGLALILLAVVGFVSYRSTQDLMDAVHQVTHSHSVLENLESVLADVKAVESNERGFVISGDERFLASSAAALADLQRAPARLEEMITGSPRQQQRLNALEPLLKAKLAFSDEVIRTRKDSGVEAAAALIRSGRGRELMARVEQLIGEAQQEERKRLRERDAQAAADGRRAAMLVTSGGLLALLLIVLALVVMRRDMHRLRQAEADVKESEARLQAIVDNTSAAIYAKDIQGRFTLVNRELEKMFKRDRSELLGRTVYDLFDKSFADAYRANDLAALESEEPLLSEEVAPLGGEMHTFLSVKGALRDADGVAYGMCGVSTDITDRKQAEQQIATLNARLEQHAHELEAANKELEAFSYSVSHDLRAPLRHISGFAAILERQAGPKLDDVSRRHLDKIVKAATQMGMLIDDLLSFSRMARAELSRTRVDLGRVVAQVVSELKDPLDGRTVRWRIAALPEVEGDPAMLKLALFNLIANAVKYTRTRPEAIIEVGAETQGSETVVFVRDNGVGFEPEYAHKLFGVFQRLHPVEEFEGTGIGLANVRRIVHRHGGRTWAAGEVDRGATFFFSVPKLREAA